MTIHFMELIHGLMMPGLSQVEKAKAKVKVKVLLAEQR